MLARIAHELFWLGRNVARAEATARMLDGIFSADLQGRPDDPGLRLTWRSVLRIMSADQPGRSTRRESGPDRRTGRADRDRSSCF